MKKKLYPKTERIGNQKVVVTEKLDGSCLGIFKLNGIVYFAQRNNVFTLEELKVESAYKGLVIWATENKEALETLCEGSCVFGEWIGMGQLSYEFEKRFYMFAKANVDENFDANRINYNHDLFIYPFDEGVMPDCVGVVPVVEICSSIPNIDDLNAMYEKYMEDVSRNVEGFVVSLGAGVKKYVRMKNGSLEPHKK